MAEAGESGAVLGAGAEFGPFDGRAWLNTAHQGPLPRRAVVAAGRAAALKAAPQRISDGDFTEVPERLRRLLATLVGGAPEQIVLGNSTSYGLHLVANGLPWRDGDEVLVIEGDYPATILPWQHLTSQGVDVSPLRPENGLLSVIQQLASQPVAPWPDAIAPVGRPGANPSPGRSWGFLLLFGQYPPDAVSAVIPADEHSPRLSHAASLSGATARSLRLARSPSLEGRWCRRVLSAPAWKVGGAAGSYQPLISPVVTPVLGGFRIRSDVAAGIWASSARE